MIINRPKFQQRHYDCIADVVAHILRGTLSYEGIEVLAALGEELCYIFTKDNPHFDASRFLKASGLDSVER